MVNQTLFNRGYFILLVQFGGFLVSRCRRVGEIQQIHLRLGGEERKAATVTFR